MALLVVPDYNQDSGTIKFLKSKIGAYYADHRSRLNTEARKYGEEYIQNNRQVTIFIKFLFKSFIYYYLT